MEEFSGAVWSDTPIVGRHLGEQTITRHFCHDRIAQVVCNKSHLPDWAECLKHLTPIVK